MKNILIIIVLIVSTLCVAQIAQAKDKKVHECPKDAVCLDNPLSVTTPQEFIGGVINGVLGVVGSVALLIFIYGGFLWMTAAGNAEQVEKGKQALIWAALGLVVIFTSYALVNFVIHDVIQG